ncbi:transketolase family protein [Xylophilus sp. GOD-11R]|uniref:transketolase family protein n=1 Tax=Xylophilus sp. GOD-11R TaxID=3089814 RepID=UPI00298CEE8F|nr:transketolase C-terminal domain-containing protein [Xylophilus sp. GOD-11R]WPB58075.1 transketolase C-terminal domain-containing protein [Xylophilus sp. GOD-11R]
MRAAFSDTLVALAKQDPNVVLLTGDHGYALFDAFRAACPDQYINAGIAEQNMVGMAAGLARAGYRPFVYGLAAFVPVRVVEQIKLDIAHDDLPVVLCGDGAGFVYSHLGTSHQSTEDIAVTRAIPGLTIYSPADRFELAACMTQAYEKKSAVYMRMGKADLGDVHHGALTANAELFQQIEEGDDPRIAFVATGSMAVTAGRIRAEYFPRASLFTVPSIKPLDHRKLEEIAGSVQAICVLEEHSVIGGLGSAIAEVVAENQTTRVLRIGVSDRFSHKCGTYRYLLEEHDLSFEAICAQVKKYVDDRE